MTVGGDVIVIGGGVVGMSAALALGRAGLAVVLVERGMCGGEASWAGAGILSPTNPHRSDPLHEMQLASIDMYPSFCESLREVSGVDPEYERCGALDQLMTEQHVQMARSDVRVTQGLKMSTDASVFELLTPEEAVEIEPALSRHCLAVALCRRTAQIRNPRLLRALRIACERAGVTICENTEIVAVTESGGRLNGVMTSDRAEIIGKYAVITAGAWSARIGPATLRELLPVMPVKGQIVLAQCPPQMIRRIINRGKRYIVPRRDGLVLIGATDEPEAEFDKRTTSRGVNQLINDAVEMVPALAEAPVVSMWAGLRPGSPDGRPFIGPIPGIENLYAATGHFRNGLTLAPITAEIIHELIVTGQCGFDLNRCAPGRLLKLDHVSDDN